MTTTESIADGESREQRVAERCARGVDHYAEYREEIIRVAEGKWHVPSSSHQGYYLVNTHENTCRHCPDRTGDKIGVCKHRIAALIAEAKTPTYRVRKAPQGDLYELLERRAGEDKVIGWGNVAEVYWMKWSIEGYEYEMVS